MLVDPICDGLSIVRATINNGLLLQDGKGLLIDAPPDLDAADLPEIARVLCTQYRRSNTAGVVPCLERGATLTVPRSERHLFEDADAYWNNPANRYHLYHERPGPEVPATSVHVDDDVAEGDTIEWGEFTITVLDTPGPTDGSVSYLVEGAGRRIVFCGDTIYGPGQIYDVYSLQKGFVGIGDYHGFIGAWTELAESLGKIKSLEPDMLVPSHGDPIADPTAAINLTLERLESLDRNHAATSSMNFYVPRMYAKYADDPQRMKPAETREPPDFVLRTGAVNFMLVSDDGAGLLIDCGGPDPFSEIDRFIGEGKLKTTEACWITHYHDDHVDKLHLLPDGVPIWTHEDLREIIEHPVRFRLPCIHHEPAEVTRVLKEGECWDWHEFQLTTMHLPGQTHYHNGLLAEGHGLKVLFAGDSGSPNGLDDHCTQNRVLTGEGRGFRRVIDVWRETKPDYIFNQHQEQAFRFDDAWLDQVERLLQAREAIYRDLLPWEEPDFGVDQNWIRAYPYEQDAKPGGTFQFQLQISNHAKEARAAEILDILLPDGWTFETEGPVAIPARQDGGPKVTVTPPTDCEKQKYILPVCVSWNGTPLGPIRHAVVNVR